MQLPVADLLSCLTETGSADVVWCFLLRVAANGRSVKPAYPFLAPLPGILAGQPLPHRSGASGGKEIRLLPAVPVPPWP